MMNINDNNYEVWLLRYAEQELTEAERTEVEQWLETHPEAAEELALYNEAPRLQRDEEVRYVAVARQHTKPLWGAAWRWAAAAAVIAALMLPGVRQSTNTDQQFAIVENMPEIPEGLDISERPENLEIPKAPEKPGRPEIPETPEIRIMDAPETNIVETLAEADTVTLPEEQEQPEEPVLQYVDDLIVYEDEPSGEPKEFTEVTYISSTSDDGINPVALFIGILIKTTR